MLNKSDVADRVTNTVLQTISDLLEERELGDSTLNGDAKLVDTLGLKSMEIAQLVLTLEDELDVDPFQEITITSIRTVDDLIGAYVTTLDPSSNPSSQAEPVDVSVTQGTARRSNRRR